MLFAPLRPRPRTPWIKFMPCFDRFPSCFSCNHNSARVDVDVDVPRSAPGKSAVMSSVKNLWSQQWKENTLGKNWEMRWIDREIDRETGRETDRQAGYLPEWHDVRYDTKVISVNSSDYDPNSIDTPEVQVKKKEKHVRRKSERTYPTESIPLPLPCRAHVIVSSSRTSGCL